MAEYKQVLHERFYVRVPGTDKLRKTAASRLKHLVATGWRETERDRKPDHIWVRFERTGHAPMQARLPEKAPEPDRAPAAPATTGAAAGTGAAGASRYPRRHLTAYRPVNGSFDRTSFG